MARNCGYAFVGVIPPRIASAGLSIAAVSPPAFKGKLFQRVCGAIARRHFPAGASLLCTNLGIARRLRCEVPVCKSHHVFGRPQNMLSERSTLALVRELSKDCDAFIDVGANEGIFTFLVAAARRSAIDIHWFEPDPALYDRLHRNLMRSGISAHANRVAVSDSSGTAVFYRNLSDDLSGSLSQYFANVHRTTAQEVQTITLEAYFREHGIRNALVKVDVEGYGDGVWRGAANAAGKMRYLVMEMLEPEINAGVPARIISDTRWNAYYLRDFDLVPSRHGDFEYVAPFYNWLFCRMDAPELKQRLAGTRFQLC
jgi:FkbM family methyltransferase